MMRLNQIFLLLFCILGSLQGDVLDFDVDTQLSSSILKYLNERNPNFSYRSAKILQKNVEGDKLDATFQVEATCDYPCQGGTLKCESIFRKIVGESLWHIAGAICAPIESIPYLEQQKNIIPTFIGNPVSEQQKTIKEPKDVPRTVEEPKVEQDFVGEPKIVNDFIEEPKAIDVVTPKTIKNAEEPELHIEISEESPKKTVPCLGCPIDINPNAYGVADLINTALRHIESERSQKHTALKVLRVQQQVVSGIKYTLLVEVAPTVCPKTIDSPSCPIDQSRDSFICEVQFWEKSWERFTQIIKNNCTNNQEFVYNAGFYTTTKSPPREVDLSDLESQILSDFEIEQPQTTYNGNDPQILDDLAWIASKILDYHNYVLVGSSNVRLNGLHYKLQLLLERDRTVVECSVFMTVNEGNVYESTIDKYHCNTDEVWKHKTTQDKRSKTLGGMVPISTNDPQINLYLKDGLSNLDKTSPHTNKYKILEIMEATKQTVSGVLYRIKAHVTISDCEKGKDTDPASCGVLKDAPIKECHFKIWDQPWLPQGRQTNITCDNDEEVYRFRQKRDTVTGGINQIPKDDDQVKLYLKDGLTNMDQVSSHANKYKVLEVLEASSQVVSGVMYRIKARITVSDCEKGSKVDTENCGVLKESPVQVCNFKIWDKPWIPQSKETKVTCKKEEAEHSKQRRSAGIPGGTNSISTDDPQIKNYLKDALTHLDQSSSHTNKYKILDVIEASRQVVSGSLYRIKAHVTVSDCEKGKDTDPATCGVLKDAPIKECHFKIWDQPWLPQGRQTNITCDEEHLSFRQRRSVNIPPHEDAVKVFFKHFQLKYSKNYPTKAEYKHRLSIFKNNLNMIDLLNKYEQGTAKYGINQFADLTQKEFSSLHGLRTDLQSENNVPFPVAEIPDIDLPTGFDWREKNAVTEVKDQGLCGSCWAFSTTGNVEGQYAIKYKNLTSLSEQELVDCDKLDEGCNGGLMDNAYRTIEKLGGLESEKEYPYDGRDEKCYFNTSQVVARITSAVNISHNETDMAKWLTKNGPIAIAINANAMQFYMGGVSHPFKIFCNPKSLDHGVLIVGYGVHTSTIRKKILPYWIVKNSWGTSWGEQGYYRVYRGDGTCGLNQTPSSAVIL
ncbi:uncharacterized protein LOC130894281 isoform X4 [Diorhabda carinulata]|uniref:uncharacterized protein LOC130894281 isoform X4 n=1 Tax=Diorhabda carinulata TaxID=1163345 RepID=UPI0025A1A799|nr:uncharacterized protein LOC130894281 isoform X4 [Diorhabda carinulata]